MQSVRQSPVHSLHTGYQGSRRSPFGIGGAIAVHAVVIGAIMLMPKELVDSVKTGIMQTYPVPADPPPPPPTIDETPPPRTIDHPVTTITLPKPPDQPTFDLPKLPDIPVTPPSGTGQTGTGTQTVDPPRTPVFVDAGTDPRYARAFQPDYPPAIQRAQAEGKVTVRVHIGADGRVMTIERLFASDPAFWEVTQRQALRHWRFRPATRDGVPVESDRVMTVHFRLDA
jgi:protein TonB